MTVSSDAPGVPVLFVRHGESTANLERVFSHRLGHHPLTEAGRQQAAKVAAQLGRELDGSPALVVSSPLARASETASIVGSTLAAEVMVDEGFRELDVGDLDGATGPEAWSLYDEVIAAWAAGHPETSFPGGESLVQLVARFGSAFTRSVAAAGSRRLVVIGHGGILRAGAPALFPGPLTADLDGVGNCTITELLVRVDGDRVSGDVVSWSRDDHLRHLDTDDDLSRA